MKSVVGILAVALAGAGVLAAIAVGKGVDEISTSVTLSNPSTGLYKGVVKSKKKKCRAGRRVTILHDQNGNGADRSDFTIGKDTTNKAGQYEVSGNQAPPGDAVLAIVGVKELSGDSFCKGATKSARALSG
jgi:hypothetical protein